MRFEMNALRFSVPAVSSLLLLLLTVSGCKEENKNDPVDVAVDVAEPEDMMGESTSPVDVAADLAAPQEIATDLAAPEDLQTIEVDAITGATGRGRTLDNGHDGWEKAKCWNCHEEDDHNTGLDPYLCAGCHGTNGAPGGHKTGTCSGCHGTPHGDTGFPDPLSCQTCHPK